MTTQSSEAKVESLIILAEECAEVIQAITKIIRWGYDSNNNGKLPLNNLEHLILECGDVHGALKVFVEAHNIPTEDVMKHSHHKLKRINRYSRHLSETTDKLLSPEI